MKNDENLKYYIGLLIALGFIGFWCIQSLVGTPSSVINMAECLSEGACDSDSSASTVDLSDNLKDQTSELEADAAPDSASSDLSLLPDNNNSQPVELGNTGAGSKNETTRLSEQALGSFQVFLPSVSKSLSLSSPSSSQPNKWGVVSKRSLITGLEINRGHASALAAKAGEARVSWVRYNGVVWFEVEEEQGVRNWEALSAFEEGILALVEQGVTPIVIIRGTPEWAQKVEGALCGPIKPEALDEFATFTHELVKRYSGPPFNIKHWEIGNEPDVDPSLIPSEFPFGCWGDQNDPFYGGGYYAEMLKKVYPAIKEADPAAEVLLGGLMLDCDPTAPPAGKDCLPAKFLEGILQNGGGAAFDMLGYHIYAYWSPNPVDPDLENPIWRHRGGLLLGKLDFIREVMARYNVNKPILMNEGALLCHNNNDACPNESYFDEQANYLPRLYARALANGLRGAIWYTLNATGWHNTGLLDRAGNPLPAYKALSFMGELLNDATYEGSLSQGALEGYAYQKDRSQYYLYWSNDGQSHSVTLPANTRNVYNKLGESIPFSDTISVGVEPIYIQFLK
ncbi:MAG: hypothetical protein ACPGWR_14885 [Ardenticatenaceae bacterium]